MILFLPYYLFTKNTLIWISIYIIHFISEATSGFRTTDEEDIKFECTVENYVKHAKRDVEKEKAKINNEENANNN